jgi:hypothetical protein
MTQAINYMMKLIAEGYDYSEAQYKASVMFKVDYKKLGEAYDNN